MARRSQPIGGPLVRNSTSQTLQESQSDANAIDPLSQVSGETQDMRRGRGKRKEEFVLTQSSTSSSAQTRRSQFP